MCGACRRNSRSEEHTSELQSPCNLVCRLLLEKKKEQKKELSHGNCLHCAGLTRYTQAQPGPRTVPDYPERTPSGITILSGLFFFNDTATTEIYTLSLHDALPI